MILKEHKTLCLLVSRFCGIKTKSLNKYALNFTKITHPLFFFIIHLLKHWWCLIVQNIIKRTKGFFCCTSENFMETLWKRFLRIKSSYPTPLKSIKKIYRVNVDRNKNRKQKTSKKNIKLLTMIVLIASTHQEPIHELNEKF